jgi:PAT family beta-lactamase induction signal transducer AmpG
MLVVVVFILIYKLPDSTIGRMIKTFWVDQGLSEAEIGVVSYALGAILTVAGALAGGALTTRWGIFKALLWMGVLQALSNFGYVAIAAIHLPHDLLFQLPNGAPLTWHRVGIYSASMFESFTQGMSTAAFLAFLTNLCDREHGATQFAILSALFALTRDVAGAVTGFGVQEIGYAAFFAFTALLAIPALAMLPWVKPRIRIGNGDEDEEPATGSA